ncbi:MAG: hypothetical protein J6R47_01120 [Acholeplasmatales bacterium]|nr:hypothetical protein [Acholeplasmatales bacterium]
MKNFLRNFFESFIAVLMVFLMTAGIIAPLILGVGISAWFFLGYIITIPLCYACVGYFLGDDL